MSNALPQDPELNRNAWKSLEHKIRNWTYKIGQLYVVTGGIFGKKPDLLKDKIAIPLFFYKLIYSEKDQQAIVFCYPNQTVMAHELWEDQYVMSIQSLENHIYRNDKIKAKFFPLMNEVKRNKVIKTFDRNFWINL